MVLVCGHRRICRGQFVLVIFIEAWCRIARGANIFSVSTAVIATIIGIYIYKEHLGGIQIVGIFLGITSLVLILWK